MNSAFSKPLLLILRSLMLAMILSSAFQVRLARAQSESPHEKLRLGVIVPLSGPLAFFGTDYVRTFKMFSSDHAEISKHVEVIFEDSAYDSKQAISAFNKLVSSNKVDVVFSFGGPMLSVLAPIAESRQIPFFATESEKSDCENRAYCSLFRNEEDEWGRATWKMLRKYGKKKIGIFKNQNQFMNTFVNAVERTKSSGESVEIVADVSPATIDVRSETLALKSRKIDALGVYLLPGTHHGLLKAMKDLKQKYFLFGVEEFMVPDNNKGFEEVTDNALVVAPAVSDEYRQRFEKTYGFSAGLFYTPAFWDFLSLVLDLSQKMPEKRGLALVEALRFTGIKNGISGGYSLKKSSKGVVSYSFPIAVYKVHQGHISVEDVFRAEDLN